MQGKLQAKNENDVVLREMSDGDFFGERALLTHEARSASVVAVEHCDLFILEKVVSIVMMLKTSYLQIK